MQVEVWSDVVCPWCYIGKRRLESALEQFPHRDQVEVVWRSFQLDPSVPEGETHPTLPALAAKYGASVDDMRANMSRVEEHVPHALVLLHQPLLRLVGYAFDVGHGGGVVEVHLGGHEDLPRPDHRGEQEGDAVDVLHGGDLVLQLLLDPRGRRLPDQQRLVRPRQHEGHDE